ncbi:MAG: hypothetical protein NE327_03140 [Lentisphaeraceae bacterium]|nr:hypothetical protein [Lentisphaeraceae bacterium]
MAILCENTPHLDPEQWKKLEESNVPLSEQRKKEIKEIKEQTTLHANGKVTINL